MVSRLAVLRAILLLPGNVLVVIPSLLLWWRGDGSLPPLVSLRSVVALLLFASGIWLMASTIRLLATQGDGTLAPWDPTHRLVVAGVYRHVRNPMISGVLANLTGEAVLTASPGLAAWAGLFFLVNAVYLPLVEEPGLVARFGDDYRRYRENVPRWIPRWRPWLEAP